MEAEQFLESLGDRTREDLQEMSSEMTFLSLMSQMDLYESIRQPINYSKLSDEQFRHFTRFSSDDLGRVCISIPIKISPKFKYVTNIIKQKDSKMSADAFSV